ncbi:hypothetical protein GCM10027299_49560 [Larkinella ripae]
MNSLSAFLAYLKQQFPVFLVMLTMAGVCVTCTVQDHRPAVADAADYPGDVVRSWLTLQLKLALTAPGGPTSSPRRYAYTGIALYESIVPGLAGYQSIAPQLNGLPSLPPIEPNEVYYWPACANAAMAAMNRNFYPTTSASNKVLIDSLEAANFALYQKGRSADELNRSAAFGKQIAAAVFAWAKTDGNDNTLPYTPPVGPGLWVPTPPAFAPAALPNWGKSRPIVAGSDEGTELGTPIPYSEDPSSAYYAQVNDLYTVSQSLTTEQKIIATFWPDNAWHNILSQVLAIEKPNLDVAAVAFTLMSIAMSDAQINLFKGKYFYNGVRPITYIRTVMNLPDWNTLIPTPPHPEFPAGHSVTSGAAAQGMTVVFGPNYHYTDTPYNLVGFSPRSYDSFNEAATEASLSRLFAGVHYRKTVELSLLQGKVIANTVAQKLKFKP